MNQYLLTLGRSWELALAETKALFPPERAKIIKETPQYVIIESLKPLNPLQEIQLPGGIIKIAEIVARFQEIGGLENEIIKQLIISGSPRLAFGLSFLEHGQISIELHKNIKRRLKERKIAGRFILPKTQAGLSSVVIKKQKVTEFQVFTLNGEVGLAKTSAVQDFEGWGKRDYGRPEADPKTGMLPPKVARMMVNLAYPSFQRLTTNSQRPLLLDPFCGVGTIPAEALIIGWNVIAGDQSNKMIEKTQKNLAWLKTQYETYGNPQFIISEATHVSERIPNVTIDAVVTEPFLGPSFEQKPSEEQIGRTITGLEKLYRGCLKDWYKILKPGGIIVIAIPSFSLENKRFSCKNTIDNCENLGYTLVSGPFPYSRPQAIVIRNIYVLMKN